MIAAVIPYKVPPLGKSRLGSVLDHEARSRLSLTLLQHVLEVLEQVDRVDLIRVVSATDLDIGTVLLESGEGLNAAVQLAIRWAASEKADAVIILPADLPFITREDIDLLLNQLPQGRGGVVAPSKDGGTGGLAIQPPDLIVPAFGGNSAQRHIALIRASGGSVSLLERPGFALDIDTPDDLQLLEGSDDFRDIICSAGRAH